MFRCHTCGRSLVGLRADHPLYCRVTATLRAPRVPRKIDGIAPMPGIGPVPGRALVASPGYAEAVTEASRLEADGINPRTRVQIQEGEPLDPFAPLEGPAQRGYTVRNHRLAS